MRAAARAFSAAHRGLAVEWDARPLQSFNDEPISNLVDRYDLIVIDHPFVGTVAGRDVLMPLEELLPPDVLGDLRDDDAGPSQRSYHYDGRHWAMAIDAACQMSAARDDLLSDAGQPRPKSWNDVLGLATAHPRRVLWPLSPTDAICSFLTLHAGRGHHIGDGLTLAVEAVEGTLESMLGLVPFLHPESLRSNPPRALELASSTSEVLYVPLAFGYATYAHALSFSPAPAVDGRSATLLGGAGLAVSARTRDREGCARLVGWLARPQQHRLIAAHGGQPGRRSAWREREREEPEGFFGAMLSSLERAVVRPRDPWWPSFQADAGVLLWDALSRRARARRTAEALCRTLSDCVRLSSG